MAKPWILTVLTILSLTGARIAVGQEIKKCVTATTNSFGSRDPVNADFLFPFPELQVSAVTTEIILSIKGASRDVYILLSETDTPVDNKDGEIGIPIIVIGTAGNTLLGSACNLETFSWVFSDTPVADILDETTATEFFVRWDPQVAHLEVGKVGEEPLMDTFAMCFLNNVKHIGVASGYGSNAEWTYCVNIPPLRLAGGTSNYAGRLEVFEDDTWGTICNIPQTFNALQEAKVACRHMGLPHNKAKSIMLTPELTAASDVPIHWSGVDCSSGNEAFLQNCDFTSPADASCTHTNDIAMACSNVDVIYPDFIQTYDGVFDYSNSFNPSVLDHCVFRVQEGAVVKFICPTDGQIGVNTQTNNDHMTMFWKLGGDKITTNDAPDGMDVNDFVQMYQDRGLGFNGRRGKRVSTVTYTARKEDTLKVLQCTLGDEDPADSINVHQDNGQRAAIKLLVLPPPAPLKYQSTIVHVWQGGFIGDIHIPIDSFYNSCKMILKFPRPVFRLYGGNFNIAEEPCLHVGSCSKSHKTWVIYNTYENRVLSPLKDLHLTFIADVSKKLNRGRGRGLVANIKFYGYNKVFGSDAKPIWEPWE